MKIYHWADGIQTHGGRLYYTSRRAAEYQLRRLLEDGEVDAALFEIQGEDAIALLERLEAERHELTERLVVAEASLKVAHESLKSYSDEEEERYWNTAGEPRGAMGPLR